MGVWRKQNTPNFPKNEHFLPPDTHKTDVSRKQSTPNFPKNEHLLPPDTHLMCAYQGVRNVRFLENWRPLFSWNTRFVIGLFALLPMCWSEIFLSHKLIRKPASLNNRVVHHFYQLIRICPSNRNLFIYKLLIVLSRMHQNKVNNIFMPGRSCSIITTFIIARENNVHVIGKIILNHLLGFHETWILLRWYSFMI